MIVSKLLKTSLALAVVIAFAASASAADWATLTGRFVYDGTPPKPAEIQPTKDQEVCGKHKIYDEGLVVDKDGGIANVVVMLKTKLKENEINPEYEKTASDPVQLNNKGCRFEPHVAIVRNSQTLSVNNSDSVSHNTNIAPSPSGKNAGFNQMLAAGGDPIKQQFPGEEGLPVPVSCNIHPWMRGWVVMRHDPYAAASDSTGKFTIADLPVGKELEFMLWQEKSGYLKNVSFKGGKADTKGRFKIKLKPGDNNLGEIKVSGSVFKK